MTAPTPLTLDDFDSASCLMSQVYELLTRAAVVANDEKTDREAPSNSVSTFALLVKEQMRESPNPDPDNNRNLAEYEISLLDALEWSLIDFSRKWGRYCDLTFAAINLLSLARLKLQQELGELIGEAIKADQAREPEPAQHRARKVRADAQAVTQ